MYGLRCCKKNKIIMKNTLQTNIESDNISKEIDYHDKIKLVPFGEYMPFRSVLKNFKVF